MLMLDLEPRGEEREELGEAESRYWRKLPAA